MDLEACSDMDSSLASSPHHVRRARPEDAAGIYALKVDAFGSSYLLYTVYQAPQAVRYLMQLISHGDELAEHYFFVVDHAKHIGGYYHAVHRDTAFFLNYIAVSTSARGQGWGDILLDHYEETAMSLGCWQLALDVFERNQPVVWWYQRRGYRSQSTRFLARLAIRSFPRASPSKGTLSMDCDDEALARALEQEELWGFGKVDCTCKTGCLTVGLIAGRVCKLLHHEGICIEEAILAIVHRFYQQREVLVLSGLPAVSQNWPLLSTEKVLRMVRSVT